MQLSRRMKQVLLVLCCVWICAAVILKQKTDSKQSLEEGNEVYDTTEMLEERQLSRRNHLDEVCKSLDVPPLNYEKEELFQNILVDDEHNLLYCYVPKVACTNWKRVLMILTGKTNQVDPMQIEPQNAHWKNVSRHLSEFRPDEIKYRLENYMKFMFARHPLERFLSAYRNKLLSNSTFSNPFRLLYGKLIVKLYRPNPTKEALDRGHDVTFEEFVRYVTDPRTVANSKLDEHWRPMSELCLPCQISYDIIGKYETLDGDTEFVLGKINMTDKIKFPQLGQPSTTNSLLDHFMSTLKEEQKKELYRVYEHDFKLFNYQ